MKPPRRRKPREPAVLSQARQLIELAKEHGCLVLRVGEFYVQMAPTPQDPHDAIGFDAAPTQDPFTEDEDRSR